MFPPSTPGGLCFLLFEQLRARQPQREPRLASIGSGWVRARLDEDATLPGLSSSENCLL